MLDTVIVAFLWGSDMGAHTFVGSRTQGAKQHRASLTSSMKQRTATSASRSSAATRNGVNLAAKPSERPEWLDDPRFADDRRLRQKNINDSPPEPDPGCPCEEDTTRRTGLQTARGPRRAMCTGADPPRGHYGIRRSPPTRSIVETRPSRCRAVSAMPVHAGPTSPARRLEHRHPALPFGLGEHTAESSARRPGSSAAGDRRRA